MSNSDSILLVFFSGNRSQDKWHQESCLQDILLFKAQFWSNDNCQVFPELYTCCLISACFVFHSEGTTRNCRSTYGSQLFDRDNVHEECKDWCM